MGQLILQARRMIRIYEKLGFMKVLAIEVCLKAEIDIKIRHKKPCFRAYFIQSGFENKISIAFVI